VVQNFTTSRDLTNKGFAIILQHKRKILLCPLVYPQSIVG
jgi:hypothetical protein